MSVVWKLKSDTVFYLQLSAARRSYFIVFITFNTLSVCRRKTRKPSFWRCVLLVEVA